MIYAGMVRGGAATDPMGGAEDASEVDRLRAENRQLAVSLGAFSAYLASKGLLDEAWWFVNNVHQLEDAGPAGVEP